MFLDGMGLMMDISSFSGYLNVKLGRPWEEAFLINSGRG